MAKKESDSNWFFNHYCSTDATESYDDFILECKVPLSPENCDEVSDEELDVQLAYLEKCFCAVTVH